MRCSACGSRDIDFHESGGHSFCVSCGNLVEENTIVSSIEFQENGDRSQVIGQFVAANCSRPYSSGGRSTGRFGSGRDSREATVFKMRQIITQVAFSLGLPDDGIVERALGLYQLSMERNFVFGRRQMHVAATCLYAICRKESKPHLLIDFSDALQINVYVLGKSFLQFIRLLNLRLPIIDPSLYLHRYALRLELGEKMNSVVTISLRIVTRLKKDWIVTGRRPDGICAAALLISSRAHGFPSTQTDIAKIFRISSDTLKRRLEEFRSTPSAQLTVTQFFQHDTTVEFDPPAYIRNLLKENINNELQINLTEDPKDSVTIQNTAYIAMGKNTILQSTVMNQNNIPMESSSSSSSVVAVDSINIDSNEGDEEEEDDGDDTSYLNIASQSTSLQSQKVTTKIGDVEVSINVPTLKTQNLSSEKKIQRKLMAASLYEDITYEMNQHKNNTSTAVPSQSSDINTTIGQSTAMDTQPVEEGVHADCSTLGISDDEQTGDNVTSSITVHKSSSSSSSSSRIVPHPSTSHSEPMWPEQDIDMYILNEEEQQKKAVIWENNFKSYIEEMSIKRKLRETDEEQRQHYRTKSGKLRKKHSRPSGPKSSASEAVLGNDHAMIKKTSKKINYDALLGSFDSDGNFIPPNTTANSSSNNVSGSNTMQIQTNTSTPYSSTKDLLALVSSTTTIFDTDDMMEEETEEVSANYTRITKKSRAPKTSTDRNKSTKKAASSSNANARNLTGTAIMRHESGKGDDTAGVHSTTAKQSTQNTAGEDDEYEEDDDDDIHGNGDEPMFYHREILGDEYDEEYY